MKRLTSCKTVVRARLPTRGRRASWQGVLCPLGRWHMLQPLSSESGHGIAAAEPSLLPIEQWGSSLAKVPFLNSRLMACTTQPRRDAPRFQVSPSSGFLVSSHLARDTSMPGGIRTRSSVSGLEHMMSLLGRRNPKVPLESERLRWRFALLPSIATGLAMHSVSNVATAFYPC